MNKRSPIDSLKRRIYRSLRKYRGVTLVEEIDYHSISTKRVWSRARVSARMSSPDNVEAIARIATKRELSWDQLQQALARGEWNHRWNAEEATVAALLNAFTFPGDAAQRTLHQATERLVSVKGAEDREYPGNFWFALCQSAVLNDDEALLERLIQIQEVEETRLWALRTDLLRHRISRGVAELEEWEAAINEPLTSEGFAPWLFDPISGTEHENVFNRLHAPIVPAHPRASEALVTVIVPCFNPSSTFLGTIESLLRQSWSNLEILVMDDCSTDGLEFIEAASKSDPRVRVIRQQENGGAYKARNAGLLAAQGEFVTLLDADDVAHSSRIETQVLPLLDNEELVASLTWSMRLFDDASLTMFSVDSVRKNVSSMLMRRRRVIEAIGYYDEVRKAADSEYLARMQIVFGVESVLEIKQLLSLVQLTVGSLSRNDFRPEWWAADRLNYRTQFRVWHEKIAETGGEGVLPLPVAPTERPFFASAGLLGQPRPKHVEEAILADWSNVLSEVDFAPRLLRSRIRKSESKTPIGLLRGVHPRRTTPGRPEPDAEVMQAVEDGEALWVGWAHPTHIGTLHVVSPEYLVLLPIASEVGIKVDRVVIRVNSVRRRRFDSAWLAAPGWIEERCLRVFGVRPEWRVTHEKAREALAAAGVTLVD